MPPSALEPPQLGRSTRLGRETYLEAIGAAMFAGRLGGPRGAEDAAEAARRYAARSATGAAGRPPPGWHGDADHRVAMWLVCRSCRPRWGRSEDEVQRSGGDVLRWLWLAFPIAQETAAHELWDDEAWHQLATHAVRLARDAGALAVLPAALVYRAGVHVQAGEFTAASALIEEAEAITAATGHSPVKYHSVVLAGWRDDETAAVRLIEAAVQDATARGEGRVVALAGYATAVLYNGLGRYQEALAAAQRACEHEDVGFFGWTLVELVEAGARSGEHEVAVEALQRLEERTLVSGTDWALGVLARSRALLSGGSAAEELYREAIERLARTRIVVHLARAHLIFGEWLRRENRRVDAREQLHIAHEMLSRIGAEAFADRCRRELLATGETVRKRTTGSGDGLTAQEAQIARLAGEGLTNQEIGAQLFISSHTVEWHLRKVFAKLGIKSRRQLRGVCFMVTPYEGYVEVCEELDRVTPGDHEKRSALFNSGAEAVENAVKIARARHRAAGRRRVRPRLPRPHQPHDGADREEHALQARVRAVRRARSTGCRWPTPALARRPEACAEEALAAVIDQIHTQVGEDNIAAVIIEPIQGEGGFIVPPDGFLPGLAELCRGNGIVFIADEMQTGFCRTGDWFACEPRCVIISNLSLPLPACRCVVLVCRHEFGPFHHRGTSRSVRANQLADAIRLDHVQERIDPVRRTRNFHHQRRRRCIDKPGIVDLPGQHHFLPILGLGCHFDKRQLVANCVGICDIGDLEHFHQLVELLAGLLDIGVVASTTRVMRKHPAAPMHRR